MGLFGRALLFLLLLPGVSCAQEKQKPLRYEFFKENGKPKLLKEGTSLTLYPEPQRWDNGRLVYHHRFEGSLLCVDVDSIAIDIYSEVVIDTINGMRLVRERQRLYDPLFEGPDTVYRLALPIHAMDHLTYPPLLNQAGADICYMALLGLLIYAPLKGMRFRDGTFSGDRYLRAAKPCVIAFGVGLVIAPFTPATKTVRLRKGR